MDCFQVGKVVHQGCILPTGLFNFCAENIMQNAGLEEPQTRIKVSRRNINNLKDADESERAGLKLNIQKTRIKAYGSLTSWQIEGKNVESVTEFIFLNNLHGW